MDLSQQALGANHAESDDCDKATAVLRLQRRRSDETMKQCLARVESNSEVVPGHYRLRLEASAIANSARAGQFVHVLPRLGATTGAAYDPLLRRAFSVLSCQDTTFDILFRVQGRGTTALSRCQSGDMVDVLGPLGKPFVMPHSREAQAFQAGMATDAHIKANAAPRALLVGGGVGVPPLAMLASQINEVQASRTATAHTTATSPAGAVIALIGARSQAEVLCLDDFARCATPVEVATDDGTLGTQGLVTQLLESHLERDHQINSERETPDTERVDACGDSKSIVYACGPLPMLRAVAAICQARAVPCQVSLEENMPCGVGVCNGCVVRVAQADDEYGHYRRVCVDGPVMWAHEIAWETL